MQYAAARVAIREGDAIAQTHRSWRTFKDWKIQLVRIVTQSKYSHVGVVVADSGRLLVIEAVMPLARIVPLSTIGDFDLLQTPGLAWTDAARAEAFRHVGMKYSQWEAIRGFFNRTADNDVIESTHVLNTTNRER